MTKTKFSMWPILQAYLEDEYLEETGISPYVDEKSMAPTFEYVKYVYDNNQNILGEIDLDVLQEWYNEEVLPMLEPKKAPEISEMVNRVINVYFIKEYKFFFNKNNKKNAVDYVLNVDKVIEEKMQGEPPLVFNKIQTFRLNYEIKKQLDKAITIINAKYDNIVYINSKLSANGVLNIVGHLQKTYPNYEFNYVLLDRENEFSYVKYRCNDIMIVQSLF